MKKIKIYQIDAFTDKLFSGNPAAVCPLEQWLSDDLMQAIALENNLSETSFIVPKGKDYEIRWFTPTVEVNLCGHATLSSAFVLFNLLDYKEKVIRFHSHISGTLSVEKKGDMLFLDFPTDTLTDIKEEALISQIEKCLGQKIKELFKGKTDLIALIENESMLKHLKPNFGLIAELKTRGLIVTAKGDSVDFVSRFFAPQLGINEDPVTGAAHTSLIPLWSKKLGKTTFIAKQISDRGGELHCELKNNRCFIGGKSVHYMTGELHLNR